MKFYNLNVLLEYLNACIVIIMNILIECIEFLKLKLGSIKSTQIIHFSDNNHKLNLHLFKSAELKRIVNPHNEFSVFFILNILLEILI